LCGGGARWAQSRTRNVVFRLGLRQEANLGRAAVRDVRGGRGDRKTRFDYALLSLSMEARRVGQRRESRLRPMLLRELC
jgi:hypothetical protein